MKRFLTLFLAFVLALSCVSCSSTNDVKGDAELLIVTTIFPQYDFARAVCAGIDNVELVMLLPPGSESHDYEPSLADLKLIGDCDLFICVGGETDAWVENAVSSIGSDVNVMRLIDCVELLCEDDDGILDSSHVHEHSHDDIDEHDSDEHADKHEHDGHEIDEHVWTTPANAATITEAICDELCRIRPELEREFKRSSDAYVSQLKELDENYSSLAENALHHTLYFADRFPFRYLTEHCSLEYRAAFSGCSSDSEPSLAVIAQLTREIREDCVPVILTTEFSSQSAARFIADEVGCEIATLHSCHNVSKEDFESGVTYLELARQNLDVLTRALG